MNPEGRALQTSVALLRALHQEIAAGRGDEAEADRLREEMELWGEQLSEAEVLRTSLLSADLDSLHGRPPPSVPPSSSEADQFFGLLAHALFQLHLRRHCDPATSLQLRAAGWRALGDPVMAEALQDLAQQQVAASERPVLPQASPRSADAQRRALGCLPGPTLPIPTTTRPAQRGVRP